NKARENARQVQCLSNMRQLANATVMFANEHKGWMPGRAGIAPILGFTGTDQMQPGGGATNAEDTSDWIAWHRLRDPVTGGATAVTAGSPGDQNITYSSLAKYLGVRPYKHTSGEDANKANAMLESVFRCPSDNLTQRGAYTPPLDGQNVYRYSYSMNDLWMND